ncbi:MAG: hypothetical protein ACE5EQ_11810 [Phycisphaerae bacterium]
MSQSNLIATVETKLMRRVQLRRLNAVAGILFGFPFIFVAPLILGSIFWFVTGSLTDQWYHWNWFFLGLSIITAPLLFRLEMQTGGDYLGKAMKDAKPLVERSDEMVAAAYIGIGLVGGLAVAMLTRPRASSAGFVELFLFGPRIVLGGLRHLRQAGRLPNIDKRKASRVITVLLSRSQGVGAEELQAVDESHHDLLLILIWLAFYGWIGVTEDQKRVFLYSESRDILVSRMGE